MLASYPVALVMLVISGAANLASMSISQTVVQLLAAPKDLGRVVGLYGVAANGLRAGSGFTVGLLGIALGVHVSLGLSCAVMCVGTVAVGVYTLREHRSLSSAPPPGNRVPAREHQYPSYCCPGRVIPSINCRRQNIRGGWSAVDVSGCRGRRGRRRRG